MVNIARMEPMGMGMMIMYDDVTCQPYIEFRSAKTLCLVIADIKEESKEQGSSLAT